MGTVTSNDGITKHSRIRQIKPSQNNLTFLTFETFSSSCLATDN